VNSTHEPDCLSRRRPGAGCTCIYGNPVELVTHLDFTFGRTVPEHLGRFEDCTEPTCSGWRERLGRA
jgi:hypothetical protein